MRAFTEMWDRICAERYGVEDPKLRRFRYGVQVNSLGADRAAAGEQRAAHRARDARGHPVEERPGPGHAAAGLERGARAAPALGPAVVAAHAAGARLRVRPARVRRHLRGLDGHRAKTAELVEAADGRAGRRRGARGRLRGHRRAQARAWCAARPSACGGSRPASSGWSASTASPRRRPSPLARRRRDREHPQGRPPCRGRADRGRGALAGRARRRGRAHARSTRCAGWPTTTGPDGNIMEATIALAHAGGTTGEWAGALREVFGEFRAPTGVSGGVGQRGDDLAPVARPHQGPGRAHGRPAAPARGQARAGRALQRRRADRRGGP